MSEQPGRQTGTVRRKQQREEEIDRLIWVIHPPPRATIQSQLKREEKKRKKIVSSTRPLQNLFSPKGIPRPRPRPLSTVNGGSVARGGQSKTKKSSRGIRQLSINTTNEVSYLHRYSTLGPSSTSTSSITAAAAAAAELNSALPHGKVFTVRPITSWIDKLASQHGSPTGTTLSSSTSATETPKTYQKRALVLKTMQDSYTEIILPFKTDKALLEEYINVGGSLRYCPY